MDKLAEFAVIMMRWPPVHKQVGVAQFQSNHSSNMRAITAFSLIVVSITIASVRARSAEEWKSRVIYQVRRSKVRCINLTIPAVAD